MRKNDTTWHWRTIVTAIALTCFAGGALACAGTGAAGATSGDSRVQAHVPRTLDELLAMPPGNLAGVDIALANLLCAQELPGSERLDIAAVLQTLDAWAARVKAETERYDVQYLLKPAEYNHSEAEFRMLMLVTVVQQDFGVHYNDRRKNDPDFRNAADLFLHGMVGSSNGGTCLSMPVLYVAVGRRLGYPLKLVRAREHLFVRWDGAGERLNVEGAGRGMNTFPDEYYLTWPKPIRAEWVQNGEFLTSLTPQQELAEFLAARGHYLTDHGRLDEARACYEAAFELDPRSKCMVYFIECNDALQQHRAAGGTEPLRLPPSPY